MKVSAIHHEPRAVLWASAKPVTRRTGERRGWMWWPLAQGPAPRTWRDAADRRSAGGLEIGPTEAILHTCSLGLQELYFRIIDDALYFASRIDPLLTIDDALLHTDWSAWASTLAIGAPVGEATPFREIRRMGAATAWRASDDGLTRQRFEPSWLAAEPTGAPVADLLDALREQLPTGWWRRPMVTLSGGWDSRLLSALATSTGRRKPLAWTTSPDDGLDLDVTLSLPVARGLGMKQQVVIPPGTAWADEQTAVLSRVQHQTWLHTWLMPLVRKLYGQRGPLLDGLAGDVLVKSLYVDRSVLTAGSPAARREAGWTRLAGGRLEHTAWYAPGVAERLREESRAGFEESVSHVDTHPAAPTLAVLLTRTVRAIGPSPLCLFAPEVDVRLPFTCPSVIAAALRIPAEEKIGGDYYRRLLEAAAGAEIGGLPSTNDPPIQPPAPGPRRQTGARALEQMTARVAADETVRGLLGPQLLPALTDPEARQRICANNPPRGALQWASALAHWRSVHAGRLVAE